MIYFVDLLLSFHTPSSFKEESGSKTSVKDCGDAFRSAIKIGLNYIQRVGSDVTGLRRLAAGWCSRPGEL